MGIETLKTGALGMTLLCALSACASTSDGSDGSSVSRAEFRSEIPQELYEMGIAAALAESIAEECPSIRFNRAAANNQMKSIQDDLKEQGYQESDFRYLARNLPRKKAQDDFIQYIQQNGVVIGEASTFCTAGQREIANSTRIGTFLKG